MEEITVILNVPLNKANILVLSRNLVFFSTEDVWRRQNKQLLVQCTAVWRTQEKVSFISSLYFKLVFTYLQHIIPFLCFDLTNISLQMSHFFRCLLLPLLFERNSKMKCHTLNPQCVLSVSIGGLAHSFCAFSHFRSSYFLMPFGYPIQIFFYQPSSPSLAIARYSNIRLLVTYSKDLSCSFIDSFCSYSTSLRTFSAVLMCAHNFSASFSRIRSVASSSFIISVLFVQVNVCSYYWTFELLYTALQQWICVHMYVICRHILHFLIRGESHINPFLGASLVLAHNALGTSL